MEVGRRRKIVFFTIPHVDLRRYPIGHRTYSVVISLLSKLQISQPHTCWPSVLKFYYWGYGINSLQVQTCTKLRHLHLKLLLYFNWIWIMGTWEKVQVSLRTVQRACNDSQSKWKLKGHPCALTSSDRQRLVTQARQNQTKTSAEHARLLGIPVSSHNICW